MNSTSAGAKARAALSALATARVVAAEPLPTRPDPDASTTPDRGAERQPAASTLAASKALTTARVEVMRAGRFD